MDLYNINRGNCEASKQPSTIGERCFWAAVKELSRNKADVNTLNHTLCTLFLILLWAFRLNCLVKMTCFQLYETWSCSDEITDITGIWGALTAAPQTKMSCSLVTRHVTPLLLHLLPSTSHSEWGHIALTSGHYYPVIMCCSAWLHLLFLVDSLMLEESNFTWWIVIRGGEAISASCLTGELCTTKSHRCPNRLPGNTCPLKYTTSLLALYAGLLLPELWGLPCLSECTWGAVVFTCLLKSNRLSVLTLLQRYEKLLFYFSSSTARPTDSWVSGHSWSQKSIGAAPPAPHFVCWRQ